MKGCSLGLIFLTGMILAACARSPETKFYVLNPISHQGKQVKAYQHLRLGIDEINTPDYMSKPQFIIYNTANRLELKEFDQWAERLDKNIRDVLEANFTVLLPGAIVASRPWSVNFKPNYQLQVDIIEFRVDTNGNSILRANYLIYSDEKLNKKGTLYYHQKVLSVSVDAMVASMNSNLIHLTRDIAKAL